MSLMDKDAEKILPPYIGHFGIHEVKAPCTGALGESHVSALPSSGQWTGPAAPLRLFPPGTSFAQLHGSQCKNKELLARGSTACSIHSVQLLHILQNRASSTSLPEMEFFSVIPSKNHQTRVGSRKRQVTGPLSSQCLAVTRDSGPLFVLALP